MPDIVPHGILSFWNVPEDVTPTWEVYKNGELIEAAGELTYCIMTVGTPEVPSDPSGTLTIAYLDEDRNCIKATGEALEMYAGDTFKIPLYKGKQIAGYHNNVQVSGDAETDGEGWLIITGDFTVTQW